MNKFPVFKNRNWHGNCENKHENIIKIRIFVTMKDLKTYLYHEPVVYFIEKNDVPNRKFTDIYEEYKSILSNFGYKLVHLSQVFNNLSHETLRFITGSADANVQIKGTDLRPFFTSKFWEELPDYSFVFLNKEKELGFIPFHGETDDLNHLVFTLRSKRRWLTNLSFNRLDEQNSLFHKRKSKRTEKQVLEEIFSEKCTAPDILETDLAVSEEVMYNLPTTSTQYSKLPEYILEENQLTPEQQKLAAKAQKAIQELRNSGLPMEIIRELIQPQIRLNKLHITSDYRLLIPQNDREIILKPIEKALYLTYLKHPEGINFKDLIDYKDEIFQFYCNISPRLNQQKLEESILNMLDPTRNTLNERCSCIKQAFRSIYDDQIASYYYIEGGKGKDKKIKLDRELVVWE